MCIGILLVIHSLPYNQLNDEVEKMRLQLGQEAAEREATEEQLGHDLNTSRQTLLQVKAQLQLAEKVLTIRLLYNSSKNL